MPQIIDLTLGIPVYNSATTLPDIFNSIKSQNIYPREIIFADDSSTDKSVERIIDFSNKYKHLNIKLVVNKKNYGISKNYNKIAELATSTWTQILDADDYLINKYYSSVKGYLNTECIAIITGFKSNSLLINLFNSILPWFIPKNLPIWLPILGSLATRSGIIYRTEELKQIKFIEPMFDGFDILHFHKIRTSGKCMYYRNAKIFYRIHEEAYSRKKNDDTYLKCVRKNNLPILYLFDYILRKKIFVFIRK